MPTGLYKFARGANSGATILLESDAAWVSDKPSRKNLARNNAQTRTLEGLLSLATAKETQQEEEIVWPGEGEGSYKVYSNLSADDLARHTVRAVEKKSTTTGVRPTANQS